MKTNSKYSFIKNIILLTSVVFLFSCSNGLNDTNKKTSPSDDGKTYITVSTTVQNSYRQATIVPNIKPTDLKNFMLTGKRNNGETQSITTSAITKYDDFASQQFEILSGDWVFTLTAQLGDVQFSGTVGTSSLPVTISGSSVTPIQFTLASPYTFGGLDINIPFDGSPDNVKVILTDATGTDEKYNHTFTSDEFLTDNETGNKFVSLAYAIAINPLPAGTYQLTCELYATDVTPALATGTYYVKVAGGVTTTAEVPKIYMNDVYTIQYHYFKNGVDMGVEPGAFPSGVTLIGAMPTKYSRKNADITLPTLKMTDYCFAGWYDETFSTRYTTIPTNSTGNKNFYAFFTDTLYVKTGEGVSASNSGLTSDKAVDSIETAVGKIVDFGNPINWKIILASNTSGSQELSTALTTSNATSLTIKGNQGATGLNRGTINGGNNGTALKVLTSVPVTIQDITILNGSGVNGGGIFIDDGATVTIGSGTEIVENTAKYGGGIYSKGNLTFTGGTLSSNSLSSGGLGTGVYLAKNNSDEQTAITIGAFLGGTSFSNVTVGLAECTEGFQILLGSEENIELSRLKFTIQNEECQSITTDGKIKMKPIVATVNGTPYYTQSAAYNAIKTAEGTKVPVILGPGCTASILGNPNTDSTIAKGIYQSAATSIVLSVESGVTITLNDEDSTGLFQNCKLFSADLRGFNTSNVTKFDYMFANCTGLTELDLTTFKNNSVTSAISMFEGCENLVTIWATDDFKLTSLDSSTTGKDMFMGCTNLKGGEGASYSSSYTTSSYARIGDQNNVGYYTLNEPKLYVYDKTGGSLSDPGQPSEGLGTMDNPYIFKPAKIVNVNGTDTPIYGGINSLQIRVCHVKGDVSVQLTNNSFINWQLDNITTGQIRPKAYEFSLDSSITDDQIATTGYTFLIKVTETATSREMEVYIKLMQSGLGTKSAPDAVGDIVFSDGTATPYTAGMTLNKYQKNGAVAVIFYKGTGLNNDGDTNVRTLGVGLLNRTVAWCDSGAKAYSEYIETIRCTVSGNTGSYTFDGVKNGKNNLSLIASHLGTNDDTGQYNNYTNYGNYPAFDLAVYYNSTTKPSSNNTNNGTSKIAGTLYDDGNWYLPSIAELYQLASQGTTISAVSSMCGRSTFDFDSQTTYWLSSTKNGSSTNYVARYCNDGSITTNINLPSAIATAIHEF